MKNLIVICLLILPLTLIAQKNIKTNFEVSGNCYNSEKVNLQEIQTAIANVGHDTPLKKAPDETYNKLPICCIYKRTLE